MCAKHYYRALKYGDPLFERYERKFTVDKRTGYCVRRTTVNGKQVALFEHRIVMEMVLGRELREFENVHHRNGLRHDNRPENLEVWTKPQPCGQRPQDLVAWVIDHYMPEIEAELTRRASR